MMTTVTPAGPTFFWAQAKMMPYFSTGIGRQRISDEQSQTSGVSPTSGSFGYWTPWIVSFEQI